MLQVKIIDRLLIIHLSTSCVCECHILLVNFIGQQQNKSFDVMEIFFWLGLADGFSWRVKQEPKKNWILSQAREMVIGNDTLYFTELKGKLTLLKIGYHKNCSFC